MINDKITMHFRMKEQKNHYRRIVQAKKVIDFKKMQSISQVCAKPNYKHEHQKQRQIKENNQKLYNRILNIKNKDGILQCVQKQSRKKYKCRPYNTINSTQTQVEQNIHRQNIKLIERLSQVRPVVGTIQKWENDFKKSRSFEKRIHKYCKNDSIDPESILFRQNFTRLTKRRSKGQKGRKIHTSLANCVYNEQQNQQNTSSLRKNSEIESRQQTKTSNKNRRRLLKIKNQSPQQFQKLSINNIIMNRQFQNNPTISTNPLKQIYKD